MRRDLLNEDSNQFGPGTDLVICMLALLMVIVMIVAYLYSSKKNEVDEVRAGIEKLRKGLEEEREELKGKLAEAERDRTLSLEIGRFEAATFRQRPSTKELTDPGKTESQILEIVKEFERLNGEYPFIFVIGHANQMSKLGEDLSYDQRLEFNWGIAGERSAVIASMLQRHLSAEQKNNIVLVSTGEFDLKHPSDPTDEENAFVEIIFGKDWKLN